MTRTLSTVFCATLLVSAVALSGCNSTPMGQTAPMMSGQSFRATLSGAAEVPANASGGNGALEAKFDKASNVLTYKLTYAGLTGPATMAHFHGPAAPGTNAGVVVPIANPTSPIAGQATLTAAQAADLMDGKWYVNVHTAQNPGGEIRGQVLAN
ncbi:MAG: CHRD domain-containing protein [Pseudomonadota bacterium]|nr:CHRD domain-containing protein [Pseudomonadota bacterium]